ASVPGGPRAARGEAGVRPARSVWMTIGRSGAGGESLDQGGDPAPTPGWGSRAMDPFDRIESIDRLVSNLQAGRTYLVSKNEYKHDLEAWQKTIGEKEAELEKDFKKAKRDREKAEKDAQEKGKKFEEKK